jgi:hypothetical protein
VIGDIFGYVCFVLVVRVVELVLGSLVVCLCLFV